MNQHRRLLATVVLSSLLVLGWVNASAQDRGWWQQHSPENGSQPVVQNDSKDIPVAENPDQATATVGSIAEKPAMIRSIISRLRSDDVDVRISTSQSMIYGKGIADRDVFAEVAKALTFSMSHQKESSSNEAAWHALALADSGDTQYLPLLDQLVALDITRHAERARQELTRNAEQGRAYAPRRTSGGKPLLITGDQAAACEFITQETCHTGRGEAKCIAWHQANAVTFGADAVGLVNSSSSQTVSTTSIIPIGNSFMAVGGTSSKTTLIANYYLCSE